MTFLPECGAVYFISDSNIPTHLWIHNDSMYGASLPETGLSEIFHEIGQVIFSSGINTNTENAMFLWHCMLIHVSDTCIHKRCVH